MCSGEQMRILYSLKNMYIHMHFNKQYLFFGNIGLWNPFLMQSVQKFNFILEFSRCMPLLGKHKASSKGFIYPDGWICQGDAVLK